MCVSINRFRSTLDFTSTNMNYIHRGESERDQDVLERDWKCGAIVPTTNNDIQNTRLSDAFFSSILLFDLGMRVLGSTFRLLVSLEPVI